MPTCIVLTGATSGIGRATARTIARRADHLILHGPQPESAVGEVLAEVRPAMKNSGRLTYLAADFGDLAAAATLAEAVRTATDHVDALVNNAARPGPPARTLTGAGNELTFQTNYLAPVVLTAGLADLLTGRVVNVASATHLEATLHLDDLTLAREYSPSTAYAHAKLALVTWSCWLAAHRPAPSVEVVSLHPGVISTGLLHDMFAIGGAPPEEAAATVAHVLDQHGDNGTYYDEIQPSSPNPQALDPAVQERLHEITDRLVQGVL